MKKISLALGGGAARGYVHIGVLKYLEENNIQVEEIAGTSMGAIIGSMFAIGMNSKQIENFAKSINMFKLADFDLKYGFLKGEKIEKKLLEVFGNKNIEQANIKLKIIATNIEKGQTYIFESGKIIDAVRASFSLPGIFTPKEINGEKFVDGGIMMNLPIEALEKNNILSVSALKINTGKIEKEKEFLGMKFKSGFWKNNYEIIKRSIVLMMKANEERSLNSRNNIVFIRPNFGTLDILDFDKVDEFIELGYKTCCDLDIKNKLC